MAERKLTEVEEAALQKKMQKERIIAEENGRKRIESFKIKKIGMWTCLPLLLLVLMGIYIAYDYLANKNLNWSLIIPLGLIGGMTAWALSIEQEWDLKLECKEEIATKNPDYKWAGGVYMTEYVYSDSKIEHLVYKLSKFSTYLISVALVGLLGILLFMWIGSLSIAPTTIIIILLIIILLNQR